MIRKGKNLDGVLIEGVDKYPALLKEDRLKNFENNQIILGEALASKLGVQKSEIKCFYKVFLTQSYLCLLK